MSRLFFLLFILLLSQYLAFGQDHQFIVTDVRLSGLEKSNEGYLRNFIKTTVGQTYRAQQVEEDRQQLIRVPGVGNVTIIVDTVADKRVSVDFAIEEQRTLLPIVGMGGVTGNFWFQLGMAEYNFLGKGQTLLGYFLSNNGIPNGQIFFRNERIRGQPWGYAIDIRRIGTPEPLFFPEATVNYRYTNTSSGITGIRYFGFDRKVALGANFFVEEYEKDEAMRFPPLPGPDQLSQQKLLTRLSFETNHLEYDYFYRNGSFWRAIGQSVYTLDDQSHFFSLILERIQYWRPYRTANIAVRLKTGLATNNDSPFAPFVLDSQVNIRGSGNRVDRGTAQVVINAEFRQTVFQVSHFAGQVVGFADTGTWRKPGGELEDLVTQKHLRQFVGLGVRLINQRVFGAVLRFDYGVDIFNPGERGAVIGVGQYF
ncbi:MAG: POTRA domain-containing protein [Tunicatimonas sp.]|uniref:POTRA domain-containing protein n=1 Tax=Tunicatimonas sp. TaxID=1940096 RepID=UPI003C71A532